MSLSCTVFEILTLINLRIRRRFTLNRNEINKIAQAHRVAETGRRRRWRTAGLQQYRAEHSSRGKNNLSGNDEYFLPSCGVPGIFIYYVDRTEVHENGLIQ